MTKRVQSRSIQAMLLGLSFTVCSVSFAQSSGEVQCRQARIEAEQAGASAAAKLAVERCTKLLGALHPSTLSAQNQLGNALEEDGDEAAALALRRKLLQDRRNVLGKTHIDTLRSLANLSRSLSFTKAHQEAIEMTEEAIKVAPQSNDDEKIIRIRLYMLLTEHYVRAGKGGLGAKPLEQALALAKRDFGDTSQLAAFVLSGTAMYNQEMGQPKQAEEFSLAALIVYNKIYPIDHPEVMALQNLLVEIYTKQGRVEEADRLRQKIQAERK
jgi:tetratricopeptide (TPR) repeat protein